MRNTSRPVTRLRLSNRSVVVARTTPRMRSRAATISSSRDERRLRHARTRTPAVVCMPNATRRHQRPRHRRRLGTRRGHRAATRRGPAPYVVIADLAESRGPRLAVELGHLAPVRDRGRARRGQRRRGRRPRGEPRPAAGAVCCAGIAPAARLVGRDEPHSLDMFRDVIAINLVGTFNTLRLAAAAMSDNAPDADGTRGVVVMTASVAAYEGQIGQSAYAASKGGVAALTITAARDLASRGIRVMSIAPGPMMTPMVAAFSDEVQAAARRPGRASQAARASGGVRRPRRAHRREPVPQRRGHQARRGRADAAQVGAVRPT